MTSTDLLHQSTTSAAASRPWADTGRALLRLFAQPVPAGLLALVVYLIRAHFNVSGWGHTSTIYFNLLADAFLHGQLHLRLVPDYVADLVFYQDRYYLYWPPFPAILLLPLVAIVGPFISDVLLTLVIAACSIALLARLLAVLDEQGIAPLTAERRAIIVLTTAFGSFILTLAPLGRVWNLAQIIGWTCAVIATLFALTRRGPWGYFLVGLALGCAATTRTAILFNGVWLAYIMLRRDWAAPWRRKLLLIAAGLLPVLLALGLQGWYNWVRFASPFNMGLAWHNVAPIFADDFARYGAFNLHYLPINLRYQFLAYTVFDPVEREFGGGIFWMTPLLFGALAALWTQRRQLLTWMLALSCFLSYIPIGLCMGTGYRTFGPRYLLDLFVPLLVLTALGIRRWPLRLLVLLLLIGCATYLAGSILWARTGAE